MSEKYRHILAVILAVAMSVSILAGCKSDLSDTNDRFGSSSDSQQSGGTGLTLEPPDFVYTAEKVPLPSALAEILSNNLNTLVLHDEVLYFAAIKNKDEVQTDTNTRTVMIYSMNIGETSFDEYISVDVSGISDSNDFIMYTFGIDTSGNIYITPNIMNDESWTIHAFDNTGNKQFELSVEHFFNRFILLPNGTMAFASYSMSANGEYLRVLKTIDFEEKSFGDTVSLPDLARDIYSGNGEHDILINDGVNLYGFAIGDENPKLLLNWLDSNIVADTINTQSIAIQKDDRILCVFRNYDPARDEINTDIYVLTKMTNTGQSEKTIITLATMSAWNIRDTIVRFNSTNPNYYIQVTEYSNIGDSEEEYRAGLMRLNTEIISGRLPDILDLTGLPYQQYISKGLFEDIYPLIDSDPKLSRDDLIQSVLRAAEIDGKLYFAFPRFTVNTIISNPKIAGSDMGWTMDEFMTVLSANPDADIPLGAWLNKERLLQTAIMYNINDYIDWDTGTVYFDSNHFIRLLEFANSFPSDFDDEHVMALYVNGRSIMNHVEIGYVLNIIWDKALFGGEIVYKGFPNDFDSGNTITPLSNFAIVSDSENTDGAWEFLRMLFEVDTQQGPYSWGFPVNKESFDNLMSQSLEMFSEESSVGIEDGDGGYYELTQKPFTQADIDQLQELIDSVTTATSSWTAYQPLMDIILESASDYFNGMSTAEDAAEIIQSRASIFVSERS